MKTLTLFIGSLSLSLAFIGLFVPLLPTSPFVLLSMGLFAKSHPSIYAWMLNQRYLKPYISLFDASIIIPKSAAIKAIFMLWLSISLSVYSLDLLWLKMSLLMIASLVTLFISKKTQ